MKNITPQYFFPVIKNTKWQKPSINAGDLHCLWRVLHSLLVYHNHKASIILANIGYRRQVKQMLIVRSLA